MFINEFRVVVNGVWVRLQPSGVQVTTIAMLRKRRRGWLDSEWIVFVYGQNQICTFFRIVAYILYVMLYGANEHFSSTTIVPAASGGHCRVTRSGPDAQHMQFIECHRPFWTPFPPRERGGKCRCQQNLRLANKCVSRCLYFLLTIDRNATCFIRKSYDSQKNSALNESLSASARNDMRFDGTCKTDFALSECIRIGTEIKRFGVDDGDIYFETRTAALWVCFSRLFYWY